jgi:hypothetical protein
MKNTTPIRGPKVNTYHSKAGSGLVVGVIPNYGLVSLNLCWYVTLGFKWYVCTGVGQILIFFLYPPGQLIFENFKFSLTHTVSNIKNLNDF